MLSSVLGCWLAADFLAGVMHWMEDRYFRETWPIIGKHIARPNLIHHRQPGAFLNQGYWSRNSTTIIPAAIAMLCAWLLGSPWQILLTLAFVSQANEVHAWSHQHVDSRVIRILQEMGIFQSPRHHATHHKSPFEVRYCVMSNLLNPILDAIQFWSRVEFFLAMVGVLVREDCR